MKIVVILSLLLLAVPASGQLTKDDLRTIVKEENAASEKRLKEYIDLKIEAVNARIAGVEQSLNARIDGLDQKIDDVEKNLNVRIDGIDKKFDRVWLVILGLMGMITAVFVLPAYRDRGHKELQRAVEQLQERIKVLEKTPS